MQRLKLALIAIILCSAVAWGAQDFLTPCERNLFELPSSYGETLEFLHSLQKQSPDLKINYYGISAEGRSLPLAILSRPAVSNPAEAALTGKLVILIQSQVHGNEPAGKEAALIVLRDLALRDTSYLEHCIFLFAPVLNPDGLESNKRRGAWNFDLNRDFMQLDSPEISSLVHQVINYWQPHVVIDAHESGFRPGGVDFMLESSRHPNTAPGIFALQENQLLPYIKKALQDKGYNVQRYFIARKSSPEQDYESGDINPRTARSYEGMQNIAALLFESVIPKDKGQLRRRIELQLTAMHAALDYCYNNYDAVLQTIQTSRLRTLQGKQDDLVLAVTKTGDSGSKDAAAIKIKDRIVPRQSLKLPDAYLLPPAAKPLVRKLLEHRINIEMLLSSETLEVEAYKVTDTNHCEPTLGNQKSTFETKTVKQMVFFPPGSFIVNLSQVRGYLAALLLEPESKDCLWRGGILSTCIETDKVLPVYRVMRAVNFKSQILLEP